jgi:hypothetical protein
MNRRDILKGIFALPVVGTLGGCWRDHEHHPSHPPARGGTLKIILQGPFAVVVHRERAGEKNEKLIAFVPFDPERRHEFRFRTPMNLVDSENHQTQRKTHKFNLLTDGLEENGRLAYIDHGFDDVTIHTGEWRPRPENYFVFIELPMPSVISFIPPAEGVLFEGNETGMMPVNHILEYKVRAMGDICLHGERERYSPLTCSDLYAEYERVWSQRLDKAEDLPSPRANIKDELTRCSDSDVSTLFFGVGLDRGDKPEGEFGRIAGDHAVRFFNDALLPSFPNSPDIRRKRLVAIGNYGQPCRSTKAATGSSMMMPAVFRGADPQPRLQMVTSVENCRAGGVVAVNP